MPEPVDLAIAGAQLLTDAGKGRYAQAVIDLANERDALAAEVEQLREALSGLLTSLTSADPHAFPAAVTAAHGALHPEEHGDE
jgi:hypothetical protein